MQSLTRRKVIVTGLAGTAAVAVAALPAIASSAGSDRKLLQLCRNYLRLERAHERACIASDKAQEDAREKRESKQKPPPLRPEALTGTFDVWPDAHGPFGRIFLKSKYFERKELSEVADGTATIAAWCLSGYDRDDNSHVPVPEASRMKAQELLAIYDDWAARGGVPKPKRERRSSAVVRAEKALDRLSDMQAATAEAIAALPAQTMAGIKAKLHVVSANPDYIDGRDQFGTDFPPLIAIGASAMKDIERIDIGARLNPPIAA